jgi:ribose transport system substrate-binding protein
VKHTSRRCRALVIAGMSALAVGAGLGACGGDDDGGGGGGGDHRIAVFVGTLANTYQQAQADEAKKVAKAKGVAVDVFDAKLDPAQQLTQLEDATTSGKYDALVVEPIDGEALCKPIEDAVENNMVVSVFNSPACGDFKRLYTEGTVGYFGRSEPEVGQLMVQAAAAGMEANGGAGKLAYVSGPPEVAIVQALTKSIKAELKQHPDVELASDVNGAWDPAKGLAATEDILQSDPDVAAIVYGADNMATPSLDALDSAGKLGNDKTVVVGLGGTKEAFARIRKGDWYATVHTLPREEAGRATEAAIQTLDDKPVEVPGWDPKTKVYNTLHDPMFGGKPPIITKKNAGRFEPEWSL